MEDSQNYYNPSRQSRQYNAKMINGRKELKEKACDEFQNCGQPRENKLQGFSSCECSFKNPRKPDSDLRITVGSDQRLDSFHPRKSRKQKSRSPLTCHRVRAQQSPDHEFDQHPQDFDPDHLHCLDHGRYLGKGEKSLKKKMKDVTIPEYMETINEDSEMMKIHKKRINNEKGKLKAQRCLDELANLKNQITQLECEKMTAERKRRNLTNSKQCPQMLQRDNSDFDDDDEEEESRKIDRDMEKIALNEPCARPRHLVKTPETSTSATETSIPEDGIGRCQRDIHRVIDAAIERENAFHTDNNFKQTPDDFASSEATGSEQEEECEETLRGTSHRENDQYIAQLKDLKWQYLNHIQAELNRLYELEEVLDTVTCKSTKSGGRNNLGKGRPVTRAAGIQ